MAAGARGPIWSEALTAPLASRIPVRSRPAVLRIIKAIHTAIFISIAGLIVIVAGDGLRRRPGRRSAAAAAIALAETAVFASNNLVCPLTTLAEELGSSHGTVTDIFLPDWMSRRVPLVSGLVLVVGLFLNLRAWLAIPSGRIEQDQPTLG
jgi:hypothetical protein